MTSHTFAFPEDKRDAFERNLRSTAGAELPKSVRPERQRKPALVLTGSSADPTRPPQGASVPAPELPRSVKVDLPQAIPMVSPDAISLDLPSRFYYYDFKDLYITPLRVTHLAKLAKAVELGSLQVQVEAISSVLTTTTGEKNIAFKLTAADYNAVLYWLRLTSFSKPTMGITSICKNPEHQAKVKAGVLPRESLQVHTSYTKSDLVYDYLDEAPNPERYSITIPDSPENLTIALSPETMADTIAFLDHPDWVDAEFQYKSKIAATLGNLSKATGKSLTWDQRVQVVDTLLTTDQAVLCAEFAERMDAYGVRETVNAICKECGSADAVRVSVDPLSFSSPSF